MEKTRDKDLKLSKKILLILDEEKKEPEEVSSSDKKLDEAIESFERLTDVKGYTDFVFELVETPFETNRGNLHAKGEFRGPSPFGSASRAPEDESNYSFIVVQDVDTDDFIIEIKHKSALIATYKILDGVLEKLDGDLPHV